jgi:hypothetical protein
MKMEIPALAEEVSTLAKHTGKAATAVRLPGRILPARGELHPGRLLVGPARSGPICEYIRHN